MKTLLLAIFVLTISACGPDSKYKNASEFEALVQSWNLVGKNEDEGIAFLTKQGFLCKDHYCYKEIKGLPCNQKLKINYSLDTENKIFKYHV